MYITYMYYLVCNILARHGSLWRISPLPAHHFNPCVTRDIHDVNGALYGLRRYGTVCLLTLEIVVPASNSKGN